MSDAPKTIRHRALPIGVVTTCRMLLIIGGGIDTVARSRHATLFVWYRIRILLPEPKPEVTELAAKDPRFEVLYRLPTEDDIRWASVVVKDTGGFGENETVTAWCREHRKLLNCVDAPENCDLYYMSLIFRGPLVVGITSGGDAPALSAAMRRHLEETLGPGWAEAAERMAELRNSLPPGREHMDLLKRLGKNSELLEAVLGNNVPQIRRTIENELARLRT